MENREAIEYFKNNFPDYVHEEPSERQLAYNTAIQAIEELEQYKNAKEQGLLLQLLVAIGTIVYRVNEYSDNPIIPMGVVSIEIKGITPTFMELKCKECAFGGEYKYRFSDIGKTVFLTKEEAEQALKQMGE